MVRSVIGLLVGFFSVVALVTITDQLMLSIAPDLFPNVMEGAAPTTTSMAINLAYGTVYAVIGGWLMARIVEHDVMRHLTWLVGLLVVFGIVAAATTESPLPPWYSVLLVVLGAAGYYVGVSIYLRSRPAGSS